MSNDLSLEAAAANSESFDAIQVSVDASTEDLL